MAEIHNGVSADELPRAAWRKSSFSGANGNCVELSWFGGQAGVRNSRDPHGPVLVVPTCALVAMVGDQRERRV
jgi:hypothetical protein